MEERVAVRERNPEMAFPDVGRAIGAKWKILSAEEKQKWEAMAAQDKLRYQRELNEYESQKKDHE